MTSSLFRELSARERALVAVAVLLDGREAENYLANDSKTGSQLLRAASELCELSHEIRMPLIGSILRGSLKELEVHR
ncbi:MAG: hypothetical protein SGJ02_03440 [bacterium]|nr:hypothetical protein [bacterium]